MDTKPLINPSTELLVKSFIKSPANAIGLNGPEGAGKLLTAKYMCSSILKINSREFNFKVEIIDCAKQSGIEDIRELKKSLAIKSVVSKGKFGRAVIFKDFHKISIPAQNSILKLLEETPPDTILIILAESKSSVLPTIVSRLQWVDVLPIDFKTLETNYKEYDSDTLKQAYLLSDGYLVNFENALKQEDTTLNSAIADAKKVLKMQKPQRISEIENILNNQEYNPEDFLTALQKIYVSLMRKEISGSTKLLKKIINGLEQISNTKESLKYNANSKLIFTNLFYKI